MDANVTTSQSEPDHDNSSLQNPSTNPAEAGTTDETRDDDHETSSIEALNWSEVEEEELAAAQQATLVSTSSSQAKLPSETKVLTKNDKDDESVTNNGSSTNDEGSMLSSTLLQSINSTVSDEDPQVRKLTVIENWASEVTNAVERGEIELTEDFPEENGITGDDDEEDTDNNGLRKRKGKKLSPEMVASMMSSVSNGESTVDPLSNAPVLDDGPIWNKGPRSYTFQENRRINQKLTFCLLIAVVLAIGLGLGNLVAHQECEAEYKASQLSQAKHTDTDKIISIHTVPTTTTPAPIIPDRSTDSSMMGSSLPKKQTTPYATSDDDTKNDDDYLPLENSKQGKRQIPLDNAKQDLPKRKRDDPVIDPKYKVHAETVSNVVHTLDRLSREIDQFENTTRKLQGMLMIPDEQKIEDTPKPTGNENTLFDEEIHRDGDLRDDSNNEVTEEDEEEEDETAIIEELIDAIEQTPDYLEQKRAEKRMEKAMERDKDRPRSKLFSSPEPVERSPDRQNDIDMMLKSIQQFKDFQRRFIKSERKRLKEEGKYNKFSWRLPEEYSVEEKNALRVRYRSNWQEFLKLIKNKVHDPIEALFGTEEDEEERTYGDVFHYPFPDPEDDLTEDEYQKQFETNLKELRLFERESQASDGVNKDSLEDQTSSRSSETPNSKESQLVVEGEVDDLIITTEGTDEQHTSNTPDKVKAPANTQQEFDQAQINVENIGKSATFGESKVHTETRIRSENSPSTPPTSVDTPADGVKNYEDDRSASGKMKREASGKPKDTNRVASSEASSHLSGGRKSQFQTVNGRNAKQDQKQKEFKAKQGKQKIKSNDSMYGSTYDNPNVNSGEGSVHEKMSGKEKKVKSFESDKVFENVKGKNVDKRRGAMPEPQHKSDTDATTERKEKFERSPDVNRKTPTGSTNSENGGKPSDTSSANNVKQKMRQTPNQFDTDNQNSKLNSKYRNFKDHPKTTDGPRYQDRKDMRQHKQYNEKNKSDFSHEERFAKNKQESKEFAGKETQYRQQRAEFDKKHDSRNINFNAGSQQNGKRAKSWQNKEKAERRERSRERGSSWGN